jgi:hypothetical protein
MRLLIGVWMAYYLLTVQGPGAMTYREAAKSKHHIEAASVDEAKWRADELVEREYPKIGKATIRLFDESGLIAERQGEGEWPP